MMVEEEINRTRCSCKCCKTLRDKIPARLILYFLSWSGFLVSFTMRNDMNFALLAMVNDASISKNNANKNDWSPAVQSVIVSSYYWSFVIAQLVGGITTQYFGTKTVFGWSQFTTAACSLCIPWVAYLHYGVVVGLRSLQGFASGLMWPAMFAIIGPWIPFVERSRFMSSFQGFSIGIGLTYPLCGVILEHFHWRYIFITTGSIGLIWCIIWYYLAFNTPQKHPRITHKELQYIEENVNSTNNNSDSKHIPWKSIITSLPVWSIAITTFGRIWIHYVFIVCGPNYMKNVHEFEYQTNGFITGLPFICSYFSALLFCCIADKITLRYSLTCIRKLFTAISQVIPGVLLFVIGFVGHNIIIVLVLWFTSIILITAAYAGAMANIVDLAPNFAGHTLAFSEMIHMSASFLSPLAAGFIVTRPTSTEQWRIVFIVSSVIACITYLMYQFCGTAKVQAWNTDQENARRNSKSQSETQKK